MFAFLPTTSRAAVLVLVNTILLASLFTRTVHSFPLHLDRHFITSAPQVSHIRVRTAGPTHAGIITHPPAQLQQAIFGTVRPDPELLPLSGLYTRGNLSKHTREALDQLIYSNRNATSYFYTLAIDGLGFEGRVDSPWRFFIRMDLAVATFKDAKGHTKLPQVTVSYFQPHPAEKDSMIVGDLMDIYELTEEDILETVNTDEPPMGVIKFLSSRVSRMSGFVHKHVGIEEFELLHPRTTDKKVAGHP
ncbi:hypothetical protein H072_10113 [Dactylellina haptotyla CBS 200.50]|uniref:Uncharacterized protein n=1 Tax=Dactylellina haptotyla (strain CBS 200.50) TaxID=1284197 RepID=S8BB65_DACHA|nr:hypothetical protein H072_10113 [Dactylellina haptotyla CBS 200.50]